MATTLSPSDLSRWPDPDAHLDGDKYAYANDRFDLKFFVAAIYRRWPWIVAIIAAALAIGVAYTLLQTPRYTATASVQINNQSDRVLREGEDVTAESAVYDDRFLTTQLDVLRSRGLAVRVAQKLKLFGNPKFFAAMGAGAPPSQPEAVVREATVGLLRGNFAVNLPYDSRIATLSFTSEDPALSAQIANTFASEFIQSNLQRKYDSSSYAREFVSGQLEETRGKLEASERALNAYARNAGLIRTRDALSDGDSKSGSGGGGSVTTSSLIQLNGAANDAEAARIAAEAKLREFDAVPLMSAKQVVTDGTVQALITQRNGLQTKLQELRTGHLDDYPGIAELKAQIASVDQQIKTAANNVRNAVRSEYVAAQSAQNALQSKVDSLKGATLSEQDRSVQYNLLAREADTNRSLYDGLLQRYKELNAAAGVATSNVSIIDQAEAPLGPSSPNMSKNLMVAFILGALLAIAVVFLSIQTDDAIRVPEDVETKLGLPLLGVVPRSDEDLDAAMNDPKSPVSEAYNSLRTALMHSTAAGLPPTVLVTSAQPSEGKTSTSKALAVSLARLGKSVVLVDADMRRPSVHRVMGVANTRGLSSLLTSSDALDSVLVDGPEPGLRIIPSGPLPPSPTELTASNRFRALIDELADRFDAVIVDSPPILGLADTPALSALVDGVMIVVEADRTRRGGLKSALRRLRTMRPIILGAVLTKFDPNHAGNRYSTYYGSKYYEYREDAAAA